MAANYYKRVAENYDRQWKNYTDRTLGKVMQYLPDSLSGKVVLDYGCGTGELIKRMLIAHPELARVVGYDPSEEMLQQARHKMLELPGNLSQKVLLQSDDQYATTFDLIVSTSVFHYLPQPLNTLERFRLLLQPEGGLILLDYTKAGWVARYFEWAIRLIDQAHHQAYYPSQIQEQVENAGFSRQGSEVFSINFFWKGFIIEAYSKHQTDNFYDKHHEHIQQGKR